MAKSRYAPVDWAPKYIKLRITENKKSVSKRLYLRSDRGGLNPLTQTIPENLTKKKDILAWAEVKYSEWLSQLAKPKEVVAVEEKVDRAQRRFVDISRIIVELTESMSASYLRNVEYHIKRLNSWFGIECEFISDWNDNLWVKYVAYRRAMQPNCQLNHDKRQLSRILLHAYNEGLIQKRPKLKNFDSEPDGGRCLSEKELNLLYTHASQDLRDEMDLGVRNAFRQIDIRHLTTERVDLKKGTVTFARGLRSAEGGQKNKKPIVLDLNPICLAMLRRRAATLQGRYFFPSPKDPNKPRTSNKTAWYATCRRAKVSAGFHCLRHTCATQMARAGHPEPFTQKFCRMSAKVIREIYTHLESDDSKLLANTNVRIYGAAESALEDSK